MIFSLRSTRKGTTDRKSVQQQNPSCQKRERSSICAILLPILLAAGAGAVMFIFTDFKGLTILVALITTIGMLLTAFFGKTIRYWLRFIVIRSLSNSCARHIIESMDTLFSKDKH